uniref:hypothetical protein n=1 Tax=Phymatolithon calcareum TaxID=1277942 RepID=UPI0023F3F670|nr:hypothetical protein P6G74_pgp120 [Phymatolithon calcareum]WEA76800.1 hypothetical protein [Phymatolithon calcareum]
MDKELSRSLHVLVWQDIDWKILIQYVDNLKSRIYKSSIQKSYEKTHDLQCFLINSPLVKLMALKRVIDSSFHIINLNSFELGYLVYSLSLGSKQNINILFNYSKGDLFNLNEKIQFIINKVKNLIIIWSIEPYLNHLYYLNTFSYCKYYSKKTRINIGNHFYLYGIDLNLVALFHYVDLSVFVGRMNIQSTIKQYIYQFLDEGIFNVLMHSLDQYLRLSSLRKQEVSLFNKIIDIFMLNICCEIDILLRSYSNGKLSALKDFMIIHSASDLVVICEDTYLLNIWQQVFLDVLLSNGVEIKKKRSVRKISLLQGLNLKNNLMVVSIYSNPLYITIKPSLYYQFILLKKISSIIMKSKSKSLFLLIVRLNMLLLSWSTLHCNQQVRKIFSLLDYLIYLKLKSFIVNQHSNWSNQKIKSKYFPEVLYCFNAVDASANWVCSISINNIDYYKLYSSIKLSWLAR